MIRGQDKLRALNDLLAEIGKRIRDLDPHLDRNRDLAYALDRVQSLDLAHTLVRDLVQDLDRALDRALISDLSLARDLIRSLTRGRGLTFTRALAFDRAGELVHCLDRVLERARILDRDLDFSRPFALDIARRRARDLARDLDRARETSDVIAATVSRFQQLTQAEMAASTFNGAAAGANVTIVPARWARRVLHSALRVLPARDQPRYREELEAELVGLAAAGTSRRTQLVYALRLTGRMWALRRALRAPIPGRTRERAR